MGYNRFPGGREIVPSLRQRCDLEYARHLSQATVTVQSVSPSQYRELPCFSAMYRQVCSLVDMRNGHRLTRRAMMLKSTCLGQSRRGLCREWQVLRNQPRRLELELAPGRLGCGATLTPAEEGVDGTGGSEDATRLSHLVVGSFRIYPSTMSSQL